MTGISQPGGISRAEASSTYGPLQAPPTTAVTAGIYDRNRCVYNLKPAQMRRARAALAKAKAGTGTATIAMVGDSITAGGAGDTLAGVSDWPTMLLSALIAAGYSSTGTGIVAGYKSGSTDSRLTIGAGWVVFDAGSNILQNSTTTNPLTFTSTTVGTVVNVFYFCNSSGPFTVSIDGGAPVLVTPSALWKNDTYTVSGLANTVHTVTIVRSSSTVYIFAIEVQASTTGIRLLNEAIAGNGANALTETAVYDVLPVSATYFNADLIFLMTEVNDDATPITTYEASFQTAITTASASGASVVIVASTPSGQGDLTARTQALYQLADSNNIPLIDLQDRFGTYATANANGLMVDLLHPNRAGNAEIVLTIIRALDLTATGATSGDSAWIAPTLTNSWVNYGSGQTQAGYRKDAQGFVHLRGLIKSGVANVAAFTLPPGYRPIAFFFQGIYVAGSFIGLQITSAGVVTINASAPASASLDGVTFFADQ